MDEFDLETLRLMRIYCGRDPREPQLIEVEVLSAYPDVWRLADFADMLELAVESIPEDRRDTSRVSLLGGHDESTRLSITYVRLQTPEEVAKVVENARRYAVNSIQSERSAYERLKAKFDKG